MVDAELEVADFVEVEDEVLGVVFGILDTEVDDVVFAVLDFDVDDELLLPVHFEVEVEGVEDSILDLVGFVVD